MRNTTMGSAALDYLPCRYGTSKLLFRGPRRDLSKPYVAFIGGSETYGKFLPAPFAQQVEEDIGATCVNLGCLSAGIDVFLHDPFVPDAAAKAQVTVIQVLGAQNMSNRLYTVHPRRNDRFVEATRMLQTMYRDVDFAGVHFTGHLLKHLHKISPERFEMVVDELQTAWQARMRSFLSRIPGRVVLLWFAAHRPEDQRLFQTGDPFLVSRDMIEGLRDMVTDIVEVVPSPEALAAGTDGMVFSQAEVPAAREMMGPASHEEAATALKAALRPML